MSNNQSDNPADNHPGDGTKATTGAYDPAEPSVPRPAEGPHRESDEGAANQPDPEDESPGTAGEATSPATEPGPTKDTDPETAVGTPVVESRYERLPGGGHRVTRRTVHRRESQEDLEETITEDFAPDTYQAPTTSHPAPVG